MKAFDAATERPCTEVERVVLERRSNLRVDPERPVPPRELERLCRLACWAPHHGRSNPWRFAMVTGNGRRRLGALAADAARRTGVEDAARLAAITGKYLRAPAILLVGSAGSEDPVVHAENRDAVAAGIQTLLLVATAMHLATFWATGSPARDPDVRRFAGLADEDQLVGIVYVGWPLGAAPAPPRADPVIRVIGA